MVLLVLFLSFKILIIVSVEFTIVSSKSIKRSTLNNPIVLFLILSTGEPLPDCKYYNTKISTCQVKSEGFYNFFSFSLYCQYYTPFSPTCQVKSDPFRNFLLYIMRVYARMCACAPCMLISHFNLHFDIAIYLNIKLVIIRVLFFPRKEPKGLLAIEKVGCRRVKKERRRKTFLSLLISFF